MQERELFLNDVSIDLANESKIAANFQSNNLAELQNRQADFSNVFKIPLTTNNKIFFENIENINTNSNKPYELLKARYIEGGKVIFDSGTASIQSVQSDFVYLKITAGNKEFFDSFPDLKISDLNMPSTFHNRTFTNIRNSRSNTTGYIYPLINWFDENSNTAFDPSEANTEFLYPCIFFKDIVSAVDEITDYTSRGSFIDSDYFDNLLISIKDIKVPSEIIEKYNSFTSNENDINFTPTFSPPNVLIPLTNDLNKNFFVNGEFKPDVQVFGYFKASGLITFSGGASFSQIAFQFWNNTTSSLVYQEIVDFAHPTTPKSISFNVISNNVTVNPTDEIILIAGYVSAIGSPSIVWHANNKFSFNLIDTVPYGGNIQLNKYFDLKIIDLYKDVMNLRGIQVQTDPIKKEVFFDFFEDIQQTISTAPDWSSKVDIRENTYTFKFGTYAKKNYLRFAKTDTVQEFLNDVSFDVNDENLKDEITAVQLVTSATEEENKFEGEIVPRIRSVQSDESFKETNYRLLLLDRKTIDYSFEYFDDTNSTVITDNLPFCRAVQFDLANDYETIQSILTKTKYLKLRMKLNENDIQQVKRFKSNVDERKGFLQCIYLDVQNSKFQINGYFYINKIENYINAFANVELVRL